MHTLIAEHNNEIITHKSFLFPAGEVGIKIDSDFFALIEKTQYFKIIARLQYSNNFFELAFLKDAVERINPFAKITLHMYHKH